MIRKAFRMSINPGAAGEYERRHQPIWKELEDTLLAHGVVTYSIYLDPEHARPVRLRGDRRRRRDGPPSRGRTSASGGGATCATSCPPTRTPARCRATCGRSSTSSGHGLPAAD
ncbi:MAG: L-rhamnose mutarotase [Comamonadaceae bacterium]|nr:L-rhamnose mutarotase [Comamonadaceae bacterium]